MNGAEIAIGFLAGILGGVIGASLRLFHLEWAWWTVRRDLRSFYARQRADRVFDIGSQKAKPQARQEPETEEEIFAEARRSGMMNWMPRELRGE